ncbi:hypothetical protein CHS0354_022404 [Potamilus streckersoni]|uniref:Uncharacterized protein n=1 Tax=Potamilus streckersoni TaxID=2493646 RepID=A0AAE0W375_9BIVA|nr:hypothetical protein CHS0354_022404 [Potamilus streckersoni]
MDEGIGNVSRSKALREVFLEKEKKEYQQLQQEKQQQPTIPQEDTLIPRLMIVREYLLTHGILIDGEGGVPLAEHSGVEADPVFLLRATSVFKKNVLVIDSMIRLVFSYAFKDGNIIPTSKHMVIKCETL